MSNLKPKICGWLHLTWTQVQGMDGMITKGWGKIGITKAFTPDFQVEAMEANALTPLFTFTPKVEEYNDEKDNEADPTDSIIVVIEIVYNLVLLHLEWQLQMDAHQLQIMSKCLD